jgi:hypothetical protein
MIFIAVLSLAQARAARRGLFLLPARARQSERDTKAAHFQRIKMV